MIEREILHFNDEASWLAARVLDITSTESASLFNQGRETPFELACRKDGKTDSRFEPNERTEIGKEIEAAIAARVARLYGVDIRHKSEYIRVHEWRMGSSFDFEIIGIPNTFALEKDKCILHDTFLALGPGLMEIKNVDRFVYQNEWMSGEKPEAPAHIEIQLQHQLEVSGFKWGCIAAFIGGNHIEVIVRLHDEAVGSALRTRIQRFWSELNNGIYPPIQYPGDAATVKRLYNHAEPGKVLYLKGDQLPSGMKALLIEYSAAADAEKKANDRKQTAQAQLLMKYIGDHEKVITDMATISCGPVGPTQISYMRAGYRYWKVTPKKG